MCLFLFFPRKRIRNTQKAEAERKKFSEDHSFFTSIEESGKIAEYENLKKYIESPEFKERRKILKRFIFLRKHPAGRWKQSREFQLWSHYKKLKEDKEIHRYYQLAQDSVFNSYKKWKLEFEEDFTGESLAVGKWITRYYAGERFLKDTYAVGHDVQLFLPGNVSLQEQSVRLDFRKEEVMGKYWDERLGIVNKKFFYTSGILSTALSFRQRQGRFEAKIKIAPSEVSQCFWLVGEGLYPHVTIMRFNHKELQAGCFISPECRKTALGLPAVRLKAGDYIFTFDWTAGQLIWKINDRVIKSEKNNLPDIPLFAVFSLGATKEIPEKELPVAMQVKWVRFFSQDH